MRSGEHRHSLRFIGAMLAIGLVVLVGILFFGLEWRSKVLTVRNTTSAKIGVLRYRTDAARSYDRTVIDPWAKDQITFASGNAFLVCELAEGESSYLVVNETSSVFFVPEADSEVDVVGNEEGGVRFQLALPPGTDGGGGS